MILTIKCLHCGRKAPRNSRLKKQKFCPSRACQNARRYTTNKARAKKSSECHYLRKSRTKRWRDNYPAHEYQKEYRKNHPEYLKHNRKLQIVRNNNPSVSLL